MKGVTFRQKGNRVWALYGQTHCRRSILPVSRAIEFYGERIAILGGVDVDRLCRSTENELRGYIKDLLEKAQGKARYALGSGNSIPSYMDPYNYLVMLDEGWKARNL